jgi:hypothetical protein
MVNMFTKHGPENRTKDRIEEWLPTGGIAPRRMFPQLSVAEAAKFKQRALDLPDTNFRSFQDIISASGSSLDRFYKVMEQIPLWFTLDARKGYKGGGSMAQRPKVDTMLEKLFGFHGSAAIHLYVMKHLHEMYHISPNVPTEGAKDAGLFNYPVWWRLGYTLFVKWDVAPLDESFVDTCVNLVNKLDVWIPVCHSDMY